MLENLKTVIRVKPNGQVRNIKIEYPQGKLVEPMPGFMYRKYDDTVAIQVTLERKNNGDDAELEITANVAACSATRPLLPSKLKDRLTLPNR
jgi:DsbC/DsbD-like thiol-disulfide interchange protein